MTLIVILSVFKRFFKMIPEKFTLTVIDYCIIGATLVLSSCIGIFFQCVTKKKTNEDYLLAGRDMSLIPVIFSLMATFMSATTLMGIPADMYLFGSNMVFMNIGFIIGPIITAYAFLPIYFTNNVSTIYEYLEMRFGKTIRKLISASFALQVGLINSLTLYAPALALSAVTNLSTELSIILIGVVCTFYCALGGMKAVLWADVFQALLMYICLFAVIIIGTIDLNGLWNIFHINYEDGRLFFPKFSMDMKEQYTMINIFLQGTLTGVQSFSASQIQIQRLRTLKNLDRSKIALMWSIPLIVGFHLLCCGCGFVFYAYFRSCDPMTSPSKPIYSADQLMPYFITTAMQNYPGLPGLCIAGIFSASLSTVSSCLNSLTAITTIDFLQPIYPRCAQNVLSTKIICAIYGVLSISLAFLLASLGNLVKMTVIIYGMVAGPILGVFILAACTRKANEKGTIFGVITSLIIAACLSFFPSQTKPPYLAVSHNCSSTEVHHTNSSVVSPSYSSDTDLTFTTEENILPTEEKGIIPISFMWMSSIALLICLVVGYFGSIFIAYVCSEHNDVSDKYLSPVRILFSKNKTREMEETRLAEETDETRLTEVTENKNMGMSSDANILSFAMKELRSCKKL